MDKQVRIGQAIKAYFAANGVQISVAAARLGMSPQALSNIIGGRRRIGYATAAKFAEVYGFSESFLMNGVGSLVAAEAQPLPIPQTGGVYIPPELVQMFSDMAATIRSQQEELAAQRGRFSDPLPSSANVYHR